MASKYLSSHETTNFSRLSRLVVDVISDLLRAVLKAKVPPPGLTAILQSQRVQLLGKLESRQRHVLYPACGVFAGSVEDLDFTLLYSLVRNIQCINIPPHQNGWGKIPETADRSLSANIDRLRVQRNEAYGHLPTASLSDSDFKSRWGLIRQSVEEIEKDALTGDTYVTAMEALLTTNMDPEAEKYYIEELEKQQKADLEVKDIITEVKARQEVMATTISNVTSRQEVMATTISDVTTRQEVMAATISDVTTRQEVMKTTISDVTTRQEVMTTTISDVTTRQEVLATDIGDVSNRQEGIARDVDILKDDVANIKDSWNATSVNTSHCKELHPDLKPMIATTIAKITKEKEEKKFFPTKGFRDAKEILLKNRVVVIKGNTGDGKSTIAVQLLHWLSQEQGAGQPLQLHKIKKLDLLTPNLKLITFIDDIFGEKNVCKNDVREWNKRISDVKTIFVDEQTEANFLIITVRNEVFNYLVKRSLGTIFTQDNLIDLSSLTYKVAEEKKELLELYKPDLFSWTEEEKSQILTYAPNIGFPQCCKLFYNSEKLQKERVRFFETPFHFLNEALSKLQECSALLFLFLNNGIIRVNSLDPNNTNIDENMLDEAFEINLVDDENDSTKLTYKKKVGFVKESLDKLLGYLVKKENHWSGDDVYRFSHDSIYVAVALLYGNVTPIGYLRNCPSKCLNYLTTIETATNMIIISSYHYTEMCERLLREFECLENYNDSGIYLGSLDVWNDQQFVKRFVKFLSEREVDKLVVLNKACSIGAEECVLYLLYEGVEPDKETPFIVVGRGGSEKVLLKLLQYDITVTAKGYRNNNILHVACWCQREDMVTLLCDNHPNLIHDVNMLGQTPLQIVAEIGNYSIFQTIERCVLNSLYRVEDQHHKCESVDGCTVHRNCVCAQYMAELVDNDGETILHRSCALGNREVCLYLCQSYPALTTVLDQDGSHCLHHIAGSERSDVLDLFTECETHVKQYLESIARTYDITTVLDTNGKSVFDIAWELAKFSRTGINPLLDYLVKVFGK